MEKTREIRKSSRSTASPHKPDSNQSLSKPLISYPKIWNRLNYRCCLVGTSIDPIPETVTKLLLTCQTKAHNRISRVRATRRIEEA